MRPEARFSDGTPVTAEDVAFTYELFLNEGLASYRAILGQIVTGVKSWGRTVSNIHLPMTRRAVLSFHSLEASL